MAEGLIEQMREVNEDIKDDGENEADSFMKLY